MGGLFGIYNSDFSPVEYSYLESMGRCMRHRGPDEQNIYKSKNIGIGALLLKSIASDKLFCPYKFGNLITVLDGNIDNDKEIWEEIELNGVKKEAGHNAELIIKSYLLWGKNCFTKYEGNFNICIVDEKDQNLILVRDRFGSNPFYYHKSNNGIIFGSEIKAILSVGIKKSINQISIHEYLSARYTIGSNTLYEGISKIENNSIYTINKNNINKQKLWHFPLKLSSINDEKIIDDIDYYLNRSVQRGTAKANKVGLLLSGGIDSMALVPLIKNNDVDIAACTAQFKYNIDYDETEIAKQYALVNKINHTIYPITPNDYIKNLENVIISKDGPSCINSEVAIYIILKKLKDQGVNIAIGGDNADSIFAPAHNDIEIQSDFKKIERIKKYIPKKLFELLTITGIKRYRIKNIVQNNLEEFFYWGYLNPQDKYNLYNNEYLNYLSMNNSTRDKIKEYFTGVNYDNIKELLFKFHHDHYAVTNIMRVENTSISQSLTYLLPYLDNNLLNLVRKLPYRYINDVNVGNKYILKKWAERYLATKSIYRKKKYAFNVPFNYWLKYDIAFYKKIKSTLLNKQGYLFSIMNRNALTNFIEDCKVNTNLHNSIRLWRMYNIELWHKIYFT